MSQPTHTLFDLLPTLYRIKDAQVAASQGLRDPKTGEVEPGPLQSLLTLVEEQFAVVSEDLAQFYDDQFIETCASWVIPYIGDLIGYKPVHGVATAVASPRAEVANTISFRRRKGTILVLEQLARDVTGWSAHAVEMFKVLAATQYMKALRLESHYTPDLRSWQVREYADGAFDETAHSIDVRFIASRRGRYNVQNVAVFLWSLNAYSISNAPLTPVAGSAQFFRFSSLGADMPLFNNPVSQGSQISATAQRVNVPDRLGRRLLCQDFRSTSGTAYFGQGKSLALYLGGQLQNAFQVQVCNLSGPDGSWINVPQPGGPHAAALDPELGRLALAAPLASGAPKASFYYGFNGDMGGGEYSSRANGFAVQSGTPVLSFSHTAPAGTTLQSVLDNAANQLVSNPTLQSIAVEITDSWTYSISSTSSSALQINVPGGATLELRAADGCRPTLLLGGEITIIGGADSTVILNGLIIGYAPNSITAPTPAALVHVPSAGGSQLKTLQLIHCTLVPGLALNSDGSPLFGGHPTLLAELPGVAIVVQKSIVGTLKLQNEGTASLSDSVVDACGPTGVAYASTDGSGAGGSLTAENCTLIGKVHATLFSLMSNCIVWAALTSGDTWTSPLRADRKQEGCVRFSYLPPGAFVPRQFECVPKGDGVLRPLFYSLRYGDPGYAKLLPCTDDAIRRGADDGGEMGAFHFVLAPLRETDLQVRLLEYLPVGLEAGIFYQN